MLNRRLLTLLSIRLRRSMNEVWSPVNAYCATVPIGGERGEISGVPTPAGRLFWASVRRSAMRCLAWYGSIPHLKVIRKTETPTAEDDRTTSTPGVPLMALSKGNVICFSMASGDNPEASVWTSTWGGEKLGRTSNGIRLMV